MISIICSADVTINEDSDSSGEIEDLTDQAGGTLSGMLSFMVVDQHIIYM